MPRIKKSNKNDIFRLAFANSLKAQATARGVSSFKLNNSGEREYGTTNNRLNHDPGKLTINDCINFSMAMGLNPETVIVAAAQAAGKAAQ